MHLLSKFLTGSTISSIHFYLVKHTKFLFIKAQIILPYISKLIFLLDYQKLKLFKPKLSLKNRTQWKL